MSQRHGKDGKFVGTGSSGGGSGSENVSGSRKALESAVKSNPERSPGAKGDQPSWQFHGDKATFHGDPGVHSSTPIGEVSVAARGKAPAGYGFTAWYGKPGRIPFKTPEAAMTFVKRSHDQKQRKQTGESPYGARVSVFANKELTPAEKRKVAKLPPALRAKAAAKKQGAKENPKPKPFAQEDKPLPSTWKSLLVVEGSTTDDGRMFAAGGLDWRDLPLPLGWQMENADGHKGAVLVGRIDGIERDGDKLHAHGIFDLGSDNGREVARLVRDGFLRGISVDVAVDDGQVDVVETDDGRSITRYSAGRILGATVLPLQAFAEASIEAGDTAAQPTVAASAALRPTSFGRRDTAGHPPRSEPREWVVASAPVHPPLEWFSDPALDGPTGLTVEETGRVYGHLATWGTCHTSFGEGAGRCVQPPRSDTAYAYFHTGELLTAEGTRIPVGHITVGGAHAPLRDASNAPVSAGVASEHYEHTGWVAADVVAGEDDHGIWVAGALRPGIDAPALREFRAAPLSGDWRRIGGNLELVGALAVNVPGFPVTRVRTLVASGEPMAFIAFPESPNSVRAVPGGLEAIGERIARSLGLDNESLVAALAERIGV